MSTKKESHQLPDEILLARVTDDNTYIRCRAIKTFERLSMAKQNRVQELMNRVTHTRLPSLS